MESRDYVRRSNQRKLASFDEHKALSFSMGVSAAITLLAAAITFLGGGPISPVALGVTGAYLASTLLQVSIRSLLDKQIIGVGAVSRRLRLSGISLLPFILVGNIFAFIAGMMLMQKEKTIEYKICIYMILTNVTIIAVSCLNLFKDYVAANFWTGISMLAVITGFYVVVTVLTVRYIGVRQVSDGMKWLIAPMALTALTGNVYALLWALIVFKRITQTNKEAAVKWIDIMRRLFRNYTALIGLFIVVFLISLSICSNLTFDYDLTVDSDYSNILVSPGLKYPFGTDNFGRCVFTRIVSGAKISLLMGLAATVYPMVFGIVLGAFAGYYGGVFENVVMRCMDILSAIPGMLLSIVVIASFGSNVVNMVIALGLTSIADYARAIRAQVLHLSNAEYVEAARAYGASDGVVVLKHIVPNSLTPVIISATSRMGTVVLSTSGLSYLGIGLPTHLPEWGNILRIGSTYLENHSYLAIFPGLAIVTIVLAFNFFGDGVRDALDPKFK